MTQAEIKEFIKKNQQRWDRMILLPNRVPAFDATAKRLCAEENKTKFKAVTTRLQLAGYQPVPWYVIAVIAEREYGGPPHWDKQLGQGDPLHSVSTHDPAGRGPFLDHASDNNLNNAWLRAALDALINCAPHAALWHDWTAGGVMTILEEYNGLGYAMRGVPSAYVWSGSDQYVSGKYVADHVYRSSAVDVQEGCAPLIKRMMLLDKSIQFDGVNPVVVPPSHPVIVTPDTKPNTIPVAKHGSLVQEMLDAFWRL